MENIGTIKIKTWNIEAMTGYKPRTTFYEDFSIADHFGALAVRDTYCRAFNAWQNNIEYMTELVMVLNWKIREHYRRKTTCLPICMTSFGARLMSGFMTISMVKTYSISLEQRTRATWSFFIEKIVKKCHENV